MGFRRDRPSARKFIFQNKKPKTKKKGKRKEKREYIFLKNKMKDQESRIEDQGSRIKDQGLANQQATFYNRKTNKQMEQMQSTVSGFVSSGNWPTTPPPSPSSSPPSPPPPSPLPPLPPLLHPLLPPLLLPLPTLNNSGSRE